MLNPFRSCRIVCTVFLAFLCFRQVSGQAPQTVRIATFNTSLNQCLNERENPCRASGLADALADKSFRQAQQVAETIQRIAPDIILLNEFNFDAEGKSADLFQQNFLSIGQNLSSHPDGPADPIQFPFRYLAPSNTGIASGLDLDNDGQIDTTPGDGAYGNDAFGFGQFEGRYGMLLLSKFPIHVDGIRTFQQFLWKDMPDALLPDDPRTAAEKDWYSDEELQRVRLSSKSHWDVPIQIGDEVLHMLASHPTPPVFDGTEDRNGRRNHDEIRLWADYVDPDKSGYLVDDDGKRGGLTPNESFVVLGDLNADPVRGDQFPGAIQQLLNHPLIDGDIKPVGASGSDQTATFGLRADYVLPSRDLNTVQTEVFWPDRTDPLARLLRASDHRLVWVDIEVENVPEPTCRSLGLVSLFAWLSYWRTSRKPLGKQH